MRNILSFCAYTLLIVGMFGVTHSAFAATLKLNPNTGVYTTGKAFTVNVIVTTDGKAVNASDGQLTFNPKEISVVSVSRASSIFNLWTEEPTFSNAAGTISFGGGSPTGYKGASGSVISITFKAITAGTPKINFKSGSILAADGLGTNVLTGMSGGTFTIAAATENPEPEYIAPANTPKAPVVTSGSHPDQNAWYGNKTAELEWALPSDVVAVRTLLDNEPNTVPTIVYDERVTSKKIEDLTEGISYFHIQFKNTEGWGKITHYKLAVDTEVPTLFTISENASSTEGANILVFTVEDISPILEYKIQIDGKDPFVYTDEKFTKQFTLPTLQPGYHTIIVEAIDSAGHSIAATYSFTIEAFEKPEFIDFPSRINTEVIPAIKGKTRPNSRVLVAVQKEGGPIINTASGSENVDDPFTIQSDSEGVFIYIPSQPFERGVYTVTAIARDASGKISERSDEIKIIVETPGYIVFGGAIINVLSVVIPLVALVLLMIFGSWYLWHRLSVWRVRVRKETLEAESSLSHEFNSIVANLDTNVAALKESRKGKLTKAELVLIEQIEFDLKTARTKISKEITDIEEIIT
ncbi:MAG: cohesin domain-containing protein [Minisyncoccia bacterium]